MMAGRPIVDAHPYLHFELRGIATPLLQACLSSVSYDAGVPSSALYDAKFAATRRTRAPFVSLHAQGARFPEAGDAAPVMTPAASSYGGGSSRGVGGVGGTRDVEEPSPQTMEKLKADLQVRSLTLFSNAFGEVAETWAA